MLQAGRGRRLWLTAGALAWAGVLPRAATAQAKPEKPRVMIAVEGRASFSYLPLTLAERLGFFAAEGLEVETVDVGNSLRATQLGTEALPDVLGGSFEQTIQWQGKNQYFREFVLLARAPQVAIGISPRTMASYKTPADLKGRRFGVPATGTAGAMVASMVVLRSGLSLSDLHFVELATPAAALAAVRGGQVDVISHTEPVIGLLEGRAEVRIIADTRTLKGTLSVFGGPMPAASLYAAQEFIQRYPHTVQALTNSIVHALKWLQTAGPGDLIKVVPDSYLLGDRGLYLSSFNRIREAIAVDGLISDDGVRTALRVAARLDPSLKVDKIDVDRTFTNEFARRAKDRFRA